MMPSILALVEAGAIRADDDTLALMQNVSLEHAHTIAKWLALTTNTPAYLRYMQIGEREHHIRYTPEQVRAGMQRTDQTDRNGPWIKNKP